MDEFRLLNRDGTFNIERYGIRKRAFTDTYHSLLAASWIRFLTLLAGTYFVVNSVFALAYMLCGPNGLTGVATDTAYHRLLDAFFFSVQTLATIGYGRITPNGIPANILVTVEAFFGLLGLALATGLLFARFSKPTARVLFSRVAMISRHEGVPSFQFRMANARLNQIVEARVRVSVARDEVTTEGETYRNFYDLELERGDSPIFVLSWTVVHAINEKSPLHGVTPEQLAASHTEIFVSLTGIDETFSQVIHARFSYIPSEIVWGGRFVDILSRAGRGAAVNLALIHDYLE